MKRNILVTGGLGFIGSNFINYYYENNALKDFSIVNLDKHTYAASIDNTKTFNHYKNYHLIKGDICNRELVKYVFEKYKITDVVNFAAESHVDNSISNPSIFIESNINGVCCLLDASREYWKDEYSKHRFIQISTDEVYGSMNLSSKHRWKEEEPLNPRSPYSASKAGAEHLCTSYYTTYDLPIIITRSSNNFGPRQHKEKFIPVILSSLKNKTNIPIYGKGENIRDWMYVEDNCKAVGLVLEKGKIGNVYNIGANNEIKNKTLVTMIINAYCCMQDYNVDEYKKLITYVQDRLGHDLKYSIDIDKIKKLGWNPPKRNSMHDNIVKTIGWYHGDK